MKIEAIELMLAASALVSAVAMCDGAAAGLRVAACELSAGACALAVFIWYRS